MEEENRILRELTAYFNPMASRIQESFYILQHLDRYFTIAKLAHELKAIRPELNDKGKILGAMVKIPHNEINGHIILISDSNFMLSNMTGSL